MKSLSVALTIISHFIMSSALEWNDLKCKYSPNDLLGLSSSYQLPRTVKDAKKAGWQIWQEGEPVEHKHVKVYCEKNDPTICLLFNDPAGYVAGYQIGIPTAVDSLHMPEFDYKRMGFKQNTIFGKERYTIRVFFIPPDTLGNDSTKWNGKTGTGLWIPIADRYVEVPRNESELKSKMPEFVAQECLRDLGRHYFYNFTREMQPQDFYPIFLLYSSKGDLHGWALISYGSKAFTSFADYLFPFRQEKVWFLQNLPISTLKYAAKETPQWALDYRVKYGEFSHHVFFISKPWKIRC